MSLRPPQCPSCASPLDLTTSGELDSWRCPLLHGVAITLTEAHGRLQEDEIADLWQETREGASASVSTSGGTRSCPICSLAMTSVLVSADVDEATKGQPGDQPEVGSAWLDVCEPCQLIWFDSGEMEQFPLDLADPEPTRAELDALAELTDDFGEAYVRAAHDRDEDTFTERAYRVVARNPKLLRSFTSVGRLGRD